MGKNLFSSNKPVSTWPFTKVLVANRGEIAVRIIRSCRALGLKTVAIYSTADKNALHVKLADEAICVGPANAADSYLNIASIITAAKITGSQAIHPGYGFLSENADFAQACEANQVKFIGPSANVISLLGDKETARATMGKYGLPIVKGGKETITTAKDASLQADEIGYPIMLKASAGGGGKGMRIVRSSEELTAKFSVAQKEAVSSFGDKRMYLERYLEAPRHIEVQIMADQAGHVIAVGERDCTIQAHHQKIIEEAPAVVLSTKTRETMLSKCEKAVAKLHYEGAGTIEFLYNSDGSFYFMEMNTRIQVEHPITELTSDVDLITMQLRLAAGDKLNGHRPKRAGFVLECRCNAVTSGKITGLHLPGGYGVRVDTALYQGYFVPPNYDGLIAKIIVYGMDRKTVVKQMQAIIDETVISGIGTNLELLAQLLDDSDYQELKTTVNWLDSKMKQ